MRLRDGGYAPATTKSARAYVQIIAPLADLSFEREKTMAPVYHGVFRIRIALNASLIRSFVGHGQPFVEEGV